jgi:hypothetical protein
MNRWQWRQRPSAFILARKRLTLSVEFFGRGVGASVSTVTPGPVRIFPEILRISHGFFDDLPTLMIGTRGQEITASLHRIGRNPPRINDLQADRRSAAASLPPRFAACRAASDSAIPFQAVGTPDR